MRFNFRWRLYLFLIQRRLKIWERGTLFHWKTKIIHSKNILLILSFLAINLYHILKLYLIIWSQGSFFNRIARIVILESWKSFWFSNRFSWCWFVHLLSKQIKSYHIVGCLFIWLRQNWCLLLSRMNSFYFRFRFSFILKRLNLIVYICYQFFSLQSVF